MEIVKGSSHLPPKEARRRNLQQMMIDKKETAALIRQVSEPLADELKKQRELKMSAAKLAPEPSPVGITEQEEEWTKLSADSQVWSPTDSGDAVEGALFDIADYREKDKPDEEPTRSYHLCNMKTGQVHVVLETLMIRDSFREGMPDRRLNGDKRPVRLGDYLRITYKDTIGQVRVFEVARSDRLGKHFWEKIIKLLMAHGHEPTIDEF